MRSHDQTYGTKNVFYFLLFHCRTLYDDYIPKFYYGRITRHNANCFNVNNEIILYCELTQTKHSSHSWKDILTICINYKDIHIKCILNLLKFHYQTARGPI